MEHIRGNGRVPPYIQRDHIDGPKITYSDGQMHWLTWPERIAFVFGWTDEWAIQRKRRPDLAWIEVQS